MAANQKKRKEARLIKAVARDFRRMSNGISATTRRRQMNFVQAARPQANAISIRTGLVQRNSAPEGIVPKKSRTGIRIVGSAKTAIIAAQIQRGVAERIQETPSSAIPEEAAIVNTSLPKICHG
jgi:hypothetical protein